jgi:hypothetical protein
MFTSFVDSKILSQWQKPDENIVLFDQKLVVLREKLGVVNTTRTPIIDKPPEFMFSGNFCHKKLPLICYFRRFFSVKNRST